MIGLLADLIGFNRKILEEILYRQRKMEFNSPLDPSTQNKTDSINMD